MAAVFDLENVPGKKGDPFRGQAVHYTPAQKEWDRKHKVKLPPIPDLRFESAYLSALRPFVQPVTASKAANEPSSGKVQVAGGGALASDVRFDYGVPIRINWPAVIWVTLRDQVIVQFLTGSLYATWALFGTPFFKSIRVGISSLFTFPGRDSGVQPTIRRAPHAHSS